jgi:hypothetical protein
MYTSPEYRNRPTPDELEEAKGMASSQKERLFARLRLARRCEFGDVWLERAALAVHYIETGKA